MLGEIKSSILNENLKKYRMQVQHFVIDPKMELFVKIVNDFKLYTIFAKRSILDVSQALSSPLATINQMIFYQKQKNYTTVFGSGSSYYQEGILPVQSQR